MEKDSGWAEPRPHRVTASTAAAGTGAAVERSAKRKRSSSGYLPSLDGWRALAILGVMMTHDAPWSLGPLTNAGWRGWGGDGVYLFFAISGLLICWRILKEESLVGEFHLKSFYVRRILRIQPAAIAYLCVVAGFRLAGCLHEYWRFWFGALFLYQNFLFHAMQEHLIEYGLFTGHFWTLAVEEHFYILLSLLLFFVRKHRIPVFAVLLILILSAQRIAMRHGLFSVDVSGRRTYWLIQLLLWPALVAMLLRVPRIRAICQRWFHPWLIFSGTLLLVLGRESMDARHVIWNPFAGDFSMQRQTIFRLFPLWLVATMLHPRSWTTRLLEAPLLRFVGRLLYSVYLWHVFFFHLTAAQVTFGPLRALGLRPAKYVMTAIAALLSYYLVEKPFIRLGHRLAPPATAGRLDMVDEPVETHAVSVEAAAAQP